MNLKQIFISDSDNDKLDKINYNFDQIIVNGGGPIGSQGSIGLQGFTGFQGDQGPRGAQGFQGLQGPSGLDGDIVWKLNASNNNSTLVPIHDSSVYLNPPTVMIGVDKNDPRYDDVLQNTALLINKKNSVFNDNLHLSDDLTPNTKIIFRVKTVNNITTYFEGFNVQNGIKKYGASKFIYGNDQVEYASISNNEFKVNVNTLIESTSEFKGSSLKINLGNPGIDKILTSSDVNGTAVWKSINELQAGIPIGTIVPILTSIFDNNDNFDKGFEYLPGMSSIKVSFGKGINNYEGWYLCHGETWIKETINGLTYYSVPDFSSFSYNIDLDTSRVGQGLASKTDGIIAIPGGADINMNALFNSNNNTYSITRTQDNNNISIYSNTNGTAIDLYKMVYIVFLGESNLYWQNTGSQISENEPIVFSNIPFYYSNQSGTTNIWTNALLSRYSVNRTMVIPTTNPAYDAWKAIYNAGSNINDIKSAWRNTSNWQSITDSAKLYNTYIIGGSNNTLGDAGTYNLDGYLRHSPASGVILSNVNNTLEGTNANTGVTIKNSFSSTSDILTTNVASGILVNFYGSIEVPAWRTDGIAVDGNWQWQESDNGTTWFDLSGANSASFNLTPESSKYYRATFRINDSSGTGPFYIGSTMTVNIVSAYTINGDRIITPFDNNASGFIIVNNAPAIITLEAFGGTGGSYSGGNQNITSYTDAMLIIYLDGLQHDSIDVFAAGYEVRSRTISLNQPGTYTYTLFAEFLGTSGNNAKIF